MMRNFPRTMTIAMATAVAMTVASAGHAATFDGGLVQDAANWTGGLPDSAGNVGIIGPGDVGEVGNTSADAGQVSVDGLFIQQTGGSITSTSFQGSQFVNTQWTVDGGTLGTTQNQTWTSGSLLTLNAGGTIDVNSGRDMIINNSTFIMNGGTANVGDGFSVVNNATFTMNGGMFNVGGGFATGFAPSGTLNLNAGTITAGGDLGGKLGNLTVNFGALGAGSLSVTGVAADVNSIVYDWAAGSLMALTIAGADQTFYENLFTAGDLLFEGSNAGAFSDNFVVSGETLSLVPEPASVTTGLMGLVFLIGRRHRP